MRYLLFLFSISIGLASCSGDFFSQTLEVDPPEYEKQFVLHGFGSNLDSTFRISLTQNYGILENVPDSAWAIPDATVEIYEAGQKKATLAMMADNPEQYAVTVLPGFFQPGETYELRASHPGFPVVTCRQTMPKPVAVDSVRFRQKAGIDPDGIKLSAIDVFLEDEPGVENFYEIKLAYAWPVLEFSHDSLGNLIADTIGYEIYNVTLLDSDDPNAVPSYGDGIAVSDQFFDGLSYKFVAKMYESYSNNYKVYVRAITEEYYLWSVSAKRKYDADDNPLAEPVTTYTNLDAGIGAFGLAHEQVFDIK